MNTLRQVSAHHTADRTWASYASIGRRGSIPGHVVPGQSAGDPVSDIDRATGRPKAAVGCEVQRFVAAFCDRSVSLVSVRLWHA